MSCPVPLLSTGPLRLPRAAPALTAVRPGVWLHYGQAGIAGDRGQGAARAQSWHTPPSCNVLPAAVLRGAQCPAPASVHGERVPVHTAPPQPPAPARLHPALLTHSLLDLLALRAGAGTPWSVVPGTVACAPTPAHTPTTRPLHAHGPGGHGAPLHDARGEHSRGPATAPPACQLAGVRPFVPYRTIVLSYYPLWSIEMSWAPVLG